MKLTNRFIVNLIAIVFLFSISGCQTAMSTSNTKQTYTTVPNEWPLRFKKHNFSAYCYNSIGCKVLYNDFYHIKKVADEVSPAPANNDYKKFWGKMPYGGIENFPSPAEVTWYSKDGVQHEAKIDIAEIFKDQRILHNVAREELPIETVATLGYPLIILEVNDRTINVYMRETIYLKDNGTRKSESREDLILAYSHTY